MEVMYFFELQAVHDSRLPPQANTLPFKSCMCFLLCVYVLMPIKNGDK